MKKFNNAFVNQDKDFNCFGCSPDNPIGLKMEFYTEDNKFWAEWTPSKNYDGWKSVVHGGIQSCLADETGEWYIFTKYGRSAVTSELYLKYLKPLSSVLGKIKIEATEISFKRNIAEISLKIIDNNNQVCTEASGKFFVFSEAVSKERFNFPDKEDF
ncbi:MAG: PaaI family thioesterase [Bacteroidales bacterium]|nr:PaaI family thioesterase [Bacteroidales bacterium]